MGNHFSGLGVGLVGVDSKMDKHKEPMEYHWKKVRGPHLRWIGWVPEGTANYCKGAVGNLDT